MKKFITGLLVVFISIQAPAQFTYDYLKAADNYFRKADYNSAAEYYEKYLGTTKMKGSKNEYNPYTEQASSKKSAKQAVVSSKEQALYNLAESYRLLHYHEKAAPKYKSVVEMYGASFPLARYHYAASLRALGNFSEAQQEFSAFLADYRSNDEYSESAKREIANLQFIQQQLNRKDLPLYVVRKSADAAAQGANYAPVWSGSNTLYFTSTRPDSMAQNNAVHANRVYEAVYEGGALTNVVRSGLPQDNGMQQGVLAVSPDGNTLFLTRWVLQEGNKIASIYSSRKEGGNWSEPRMLGTDINVPGYSAQQPFVMPDGKHLLFASNRESGQGGFDLWMADIDASGNVANPVNLGPSINTKYDEEAPFYHAPSGSLVFSTNGRVGMGGFDFFISKGKPGAWSEPVNLGYPVNSVKDDIYFVSRGDARNILGDVMISSDREAACCLELFTVKKSFTVKQVSGMVISCDDKAPLPGATVNIIDPASNTTVMTRTTGDDGAYSFTMDEFQPLVAVASSPGYEDGRIDFRGPDDVMVTQLKNPAICLEPVFPPPVGTVEEIPNIYFDYDSSSIKQESFVYLDELAEKMLKKPNAVLEIGGHTDGKGDDMYNMNLSEARARSVVEYLLSKGVKQEQLVAKGYGETMPVAPNEKPDGTDNPEGRAKNRRTEFKVLQR
ncbi:MAG: OmpA family protein [Terrimonas sp.]|nr:OmpA family protein [Terrimonas sp.]